MAKSKMIRQAYPVLLIVDGKEVVPATAVTLPRDEAEKIAAMFGTVAALVDVDEPDAPDKPNDTGNGVDHAALQAAVDAAQAAYDQAKAALDAQGAGDPELKAFEQAEADLDAAEAALQQAGGQ